MKLYKNQNNELFAYELDGSQDHLIPVEHVAITNEEAEVLRIQQQQHMQQQMYDSLTYAEKRAVEYPDFKEYLDGIVKGDQAQIQKYIDDCLAVKAKYPKV